MNAIAGDNWLLLSGLTIFLVVGLTVILPNLMPNARGRLNRQRRELRHRQYQARQAALAVRRADRRYQSMLRKADNIRPLKLQEARDSAADLKTLQGHAEDRVLVAENLLRRTILEEYPPSRQQEMLAKFLQPNEVKARPFGF